jgi:hypothetical protein
MRAKYQKKIAESKESGSRDQGIKGSRDQGIKGSRDQGIKGSNQLMLKSSLLSLMFIKKMD